MKRILDLLLRVKCSKIGFKPKRQCKTTAKPAAVSLPIVVVSELVALSEPVKKRGRPKKIQDPIQLRNPSPVHVAKKSSIVIIGSRTTRSNKNTL